MKIRQELNNITDMKLRQRLQGYFRDYEIRSHIDNRNQITSCESEIKDFIKREYRKRVAISVLTLGIVPLVFYLMTLWKQKFHKIKKDYPLQFSKVPEYKLNPILEKLQSLKDTTKPMSADEITGRIDRLAVNDSTLSLVEKRKLNFAKYKINDDTAVKVAEMLMTNTTLVSVILSNNDISEDGAIAIATALKLNRTLRTLYLDHNAIGAIAFSSFVTMLHHNTSLQTLKLNDNHRYGNSDWLDDLANGLKDENITSICRLDVAKNTPPLRHVSSDQYPPEAYHTEYVQAPTFGGYSSNSYGSGFDIYPVRRVRHDYKPRYCSHIARRDSAILANQEIERQKSKSNHVWSLSRKNRTNATGNNFHHFMRLAHFYRAIQKQQSGLKLLSKDTLILLFSFVSPVYNDRVSKLHHNSIFKRVDELVANRDVPIKYEKPPVCLILLDMLACFSIKL